MLDQRTLLERYVASGKLMQLSSIMPDGSPAMCHVWYSHSFDPDRLYFISRKDRVHSANIRRDPRVAGGIIAITLTGLGQPVRGVAFSGTATQCADEARVPLERFTERWPHARSTITPERLAKGETVSRIYEIHVAEWVLFDEVSFPDAPRRVIEGRK